MLILTLACGDAAPPDDAAVYAALLADPEPDPEVALPACLGLANEHARGDCAMAVALSAGRHPEVAPEAHCDRVPEGTWRYECYFQAAEISRGWRPREEQAALCRRAGPFADDCAQHLWQNAVVELVRGRGAGAFGAVIDDARAVYATWEPALGESTDFRRRFWRHLFWTGFEIDGPPMDLAACAPLDVDARRACRGTGARLFVTRLRRALLSGGRPGLPARGGVEAFCAGPSDLSALSTRLPSAAGAPDPALEDALAGEHERICDGGEPVFKPGPGKVGVGQGVAPR